MCAFASFNPRVAKNKCDNLSPRPDVKQSSEGGVSAAAGGSVWFHVHKAGRWFRMRSGSFEKERVFHQNVIGMPSCEHSGPLFAQRAKPCCWQESICSLFIISSVLFRRRTTTRCKIFAIWGPMRSVISLQSCYFCLGPDSETACILKWHATSRRSRWIALAESLSSLIGGFLSVWNPNVPLFSVT